MNCGACGNEIIPGQKYCTRCGSEMVIYCPGCGKKLKFNERFCTACGRLLEFKKKDCSEVKAEEVRPNVTADIDKDYDCYREALADKSKKEKVLLGINSLAIAVLALIYFINNPGCDFLDICVMTCLIAAVLFAIYGLLAGALGVYGASSYLVKYERIKENVGKKEAVMFIEKEYRPGQHGKGLALSQIKTVGGCAGGCVQSLIGFSVSIITVILAMAFC